MYFSLFTDLFAYGIDKLKEQCRSPINFAYGLAFLSLIMAIAALILAFNRCFPSCPHEWIMFQEKCYYYDQNQATWTNARGTCHDLGADLVVIGSEEEQDFLIYNIPQKGTYWIGYRDTEGKKPGMDGSVSPNRFLFKRIKCHGTTFLSE
nr:PREDICTED: CD209 antigen-like protein A [Anolis carolinensis]|eukprot:XP_008102426.2 PREDICTED: CD209 antigen-like protein A [Anolis carolinensis]